MDRWQQEYPVTTLVAHNGLVGLPEGQMGNSEVGHLNIGAGRIVYQDFTRINKAIESGEFLENRILAAVMENLARGKSLHLFGLLSDGGVHSHLNHLIALLTMAKSKGLSRVYIHCFMDGRDTPPKSGGKYMQQLVDAMEDIGVGQVATVAGRFWAMDRDNRWDRVEKAWKAIVDGEGKIALNGKQAVASAYMRDETDEFIAPTVIVGESDRPLATVKDGDAIIFFNFRADRARELCHAFIDKTFNGFQIANRPAIMNLITFTEYEDSFDCPVVFPPMLMDHILGEEISRNNLRQLRIAETEKYAHVTYFFNGGREIPFPGEDRILIESPRDVATYDKKPEMSAVEVTDKLLSILLEKESEGNPYDFIVLNFANCDMVGHTGMLNAATRACETVDACLGRIYDFFKERNGTILITADHGNAEIMIDCTSHEPYTAHTLNPVPCILINDNKYKKCSLKKGGALKDIAPTVLSLMNLPVPAEMEGETLIKC
jgi:2,3-bisphosphoglycerate-independent phosphoglycerate mutase